jgi:hypothetical protein
MSAGGLYLQKKPEGGVAKFGGRFAYECWATETESIVKKGFRVIFQTNFLNIKKNTCMYFF